MGLLSRSNRKSIFLVLVIFCVLVIASCPMNPGDGSFLDDIPTAAEVGEPLFSVVPLLNDDFVSIVPLVNLNPTGHTFPTGHHYLYLTDPGAAVPIYAPGRIWVTMINSSYHHIADFTDYSIIFYGCREVKAYFGHVSALAGGVLDAFMNAPVGSSDTYSTSGETYTVTDKTVFVEVNAGTLIGYAGNAGSLAMDFGVVDERVTHGFANPAKFSGKDYLSAVPCMGYFTATPRSYLENACGEYDGSTQRTVPPIGGTIEQDIAGTAQGIWFLPGQPTYPEDPHLALVHDNVDPAQPVFSVGNSIPGLSSGTYSYTPVASGTVHRDFGEITTDGNIYIFHFGTESTILLEMLFDTSLKIERQNYSDVGPYSFTGNAVLFER